MRVGNSRSNLWLGQNDLQHGMTVGDTTDFLTQVQINGLFNDYEYHSLFHPKNHFLNQLLFTILYHS